MGLGSQLRWHRLGRIHGGIPHGSGEACGLGKCMVWGTHQRLGNCHIEKEDHVTAAEGSNSQ